MPYSTNYDAVFSVPYEDIRDEQIELLRGSDVKKYRLKTIISGDILESEGYPIWNTSKKAEVPAVREVSRSIQQELNFKNVRKKVTRLLNSNFSSEDMWITVGYRDGELPESEAAARRDVVNYIRRLQRYCQKKGLPKLKYLYVTEYSENVRVHHHIVLNFKDRDVAEKLWKKGKYPQARRLQPDDYGLEGLARYISKECRGSKSYGYSLNLHKSWQKPFAKVADSKLSKRKAARIAMGEVSPKEFYENLYKGYKFLDLQVYYSDYVSGCYLYARMRKMN